ncbi:hypothetical protein J6590_005946 [Homalodisca vitripennis]|nr:hypothetical protein J6590_005946 [Homalodisca vitripennis]
MVLLSGRWRDKELIARSEVEVELDVERRLGTGTNESILSDPNLMQISEAEVCQWHGKTGRLTVVFRLSQHRASFIILFVLSTQQTWKLGAERSEYGRAEPGAWGPH